MSFSFENLHNLKTHCIPWPNSLGCLHTDAQNFSSVTYFATGKQRQWLNTSQWLFFSNNEIGEN